MKLQKVWNYAIVSIVLFIIYSCTGSSSPVGNAFSETDARLAEAHIKSAGVFFENGDFRKAAKEFEKAGNLYSEKGIAEGEARAMLGLVRSLCELGEYRRASETINRSVSATEKLADKNTSSVILAELGQLSVLAGDEKKGSELVLKSRTFSGDKGIPFAEALEFFSAGARDISREEYASAAENYSRAAEISEKAGSRSLSVRAFINAAKAQILQKNFPGASLYLGRAESACASLHENHEKAVILTAIADLQADISANSDQKSRKKNLAKAFETAGEALIISEKNDDIAGQSLALGSRGKIMELSDDLPVALDQTMKAILKAASIDLDPGLMRFHWQAGRIFGKMGKIDKAIESCRESVYHLEKIRPEMSVECRGNPIAFREITGPVYQELVSLLVKRAGMAKESNQSEKDLEEVFLTVEKLKTEEIKDYFRDDCVASIKGNILESGNAFEKTAAIYPIIMKDELIVLVKFQNKIKDFRSKISASELAEAAGNFRQRISDPSNRFYLADSRKLYDLLIRPMEKDLAEEKIDTIIFVPDGPLRSIPIAALNDGSVFLVEKYAIGTTPGLTMTDSQPLKKNMIRLLAAGLTDAVQGFPGLPGVYGELETIESQFGARQLINREFSEANMEGALEKAPYSIVHVASHGVFDRDPDKTFILTYEGRLNMNGLGRLMTNPKMKAPVEMITLSACETAAGDDRSALGLAGVALRSGAKSALASLWFVDDDATSRLITGFYDNIKNGKTASKAKALREAQISLIHDERSGHPALWAPFLVIGNWL